MSAHHPSHGASPRWWRVPLIVSSIGAILGIAVLRPWHLQADPSDARAAWVAIQQVTLVALTVMAWLTPRLTGLRHTVVARATAVAVGTQLMISVWDNQLGGAYELYGTTTDTTVRTVLTVATGAALVVVFAAITRGRIRTAGHDITMIVDAVVMSFAVGIVVWETLSSQLSITRTTVSAVAMATAIVVASTAVFVRLLLSSSRRSGTVRLLALALALGTASLVRFAVDIAGGAPPRNHWWELPLTLAYAAVVAAILHPSMRTLVEGERESQAAESTLRATMLCAAVVMPATVSLVRALAALRAASGDQWLTILSLPSAVAGVVITVGVAWRLGRLVREREQTQRTLEHRSRHDDLTGLPNRTYLLERLHEGVEAVRTLPGPADGGFGLMFLDLDGFKAINDNYGHHAGDVVLIEVARRLTRAVRTEDFVGRMAGDEFVLLCAVPADERSLAVLAARVRSAVEAPMPVEFGVVTPRVSIGVVEVDRSIASTRDAVSSILRTVDARMYESKREARQVQAPEQPAAADRAHVHDETA